MALQGIKFGLTIPPWPSSVSGLPNIGGVAYTLDAGSEKAAVIDSAVAAKSIRKVRFRTGTVTTGATLDIRIETLDASGDPSGTLWAANTNVSHVLNATDDNVWLVTGALTADATLAVGDKYAIVIVNPVDGTC